MNIRKTGKVKFWCAVVGAVPDFRLLVRSKILNSTHQQNCTSHWAPKVTQSDSRNVGSWDAGECDDDDDDDDNGDDDDDDNGVRSQKPNIEIGFLFHFWHFWQFPCGGYHSESQ